MQKLILPAFCVLLAPFLILKAMGMIERVNIDKETTVEFGTSNVGDLLPGEADTIDVEIKTEGIELSYSVKELRVKAGEIVRIGYINQSDMNHNMVFVREEADIRPVGIAALQAIANDWIPEKEMDRIFAYSKLAHAGDTVEVSFKVPPPGSYPYICTYSAHWTQMQGRLISTE